MEQTNTFTFEGADQYEEITYCFEAIPIADDFAINILWFEDSSGQMCWDIPPLVREQAVQHAKEWAEENFNMDEWLEDRKYHGKERV